MRKLITVSLLLLCLLLGACAAQAPDASTAATETTADPAGQLPTVAGFEPQANWQPVTGQGLSILAAGSYSGRYFEDGSDEAVEQVAALLVKNTGETTVEYAEITAGSSSFVLSGLPAGATVLVQEAARGTDPVVDAVVSTCVPAASLVEQYDADFEVYLGDGVINIRNVSGRSFANDVSVYYKNVENGVLLGGITYRARFSGIESDAIGQSIQSHATEAQSAVVYLSYAD